ncbi:hypothetical protein BC938DRAFT_484019, partial [Jimgerdemannia flammicorona]
SALLLRKVLSHSFKICEFWLRWLIRVHLFIFSSEQETKPTTNNLILSNSQLMGDRKTPMTPKAAARIQSSVAKQSGGGVRKDTFAARVQSAAAQNVNRGVVGSDGVAKTTSGVIVAKKYYSLWNAYEEREIIKPMTSTLLASTSKRSEVVEPVAFKIYSTK